MHDEIVWLKEQRRFAFLVSRNAFYSVVAYNPYALDCFQVENDDYDLWEERSIIFEEEEDE